jgi:hypothetical protein
MSLDGYFGIIMGNFKHLCFIKTGYLSKKLFQEVDDAIGLLAILSQYKLTRYYKYEIFLPYYLNKSFV